MNQKTLTVLEKVLAGQDRDARVEFEPESILFQLEHRANSIVKRVNAFLPPHARLQPYIAFCEDPSYGAFSFRKDDFDFIVLNVGLVLKLTNFFQQMMATPCLWPIWNILPQRAPNDPLPTALAIVFMTESFDQIVRHEFAHLVLRHVDEDAKVIRTDRVAQHALELAADGHAAIWGLEPLHDLPRKLNKARGPVGDAYREFLKTPHDAFVNYLLVIFLIFRLMDNNNWTEEALKSRPHPPGPMRFHVACIHLIDHFQQNEDAESQTKILQAMEIIWELGEQIFASTFGKEPDPKIKQLTLSEMSEAHYELMSAKAQMLPTHLFGVAGRSPPNR
jgi:hypothetical protein